MKSLLLIATLLAQGLQFQGLSGVVTGRLLSKEGSPAPGVRVSAMVVPDGNTPSTLVSSVETDTAGRYSLENIPPGRYYVTAGLVEQPTYYPGVAALSGATAIEVSAGRTISDINFTMAIPAGVFVRGRVIGLPASASPLQRITMTGVGVSALDGGLKADGSFEFTKVRPGTYSLMVLAPGALTQPTSLAVANEDITGIEIAVTPTTAVAGRVVVEDGGPRPRFQISFAAFKGTGPQTPTAVSGPNGEFRTAVPEGDFRIAWTALPQGYYVKSITSGSTDLLANPFTVAFSKTSPPIIVTLGVSSPAPWVKVAGRLARPSGSQTPLPKTIGLMGTVLADVLEDLINPDGTFSFPMVLPGTYLVRMTPMPPMPLKQILIPSKDVSNLEIAIPATKDVPGRVIVDGTGTVSRLVFTLAEPTGTFTVSALVEPDRTFQVALPEGERRINVNAPGFTVQSFSYGSTNLLRDPLRVSAADSAAFNITLTFTGAATGTTTGSTTGLTIATPFGPIPTPPTGVITFSSSSFSTSTAAPPTPAATPPPSPTAALGADVAAANLISRVDPIYPDAARAARISGVVVLNVGITKEGAVENVSAVSGHPLLVQPAIDAVKQWKYRPVVINNQATAVVTTVTVSFQFQ